MIRRAVVSLSLLLLITSSSGAQNGTDGVSNYAAVPFGIGEKQVYKVKLGYVGVRGDGILEVMDLDTVQGRPVYQLRMQIKGGLPFAHVDDTYQSWFDARSLVSRRFKQDQKEVKYERHRFFEFYPEERRWRRLDIVETGTMETDMPLDDLSFMFYIRTLPLEIGKTYTMNRYFKDDSNPVIVKVLRKERITVPAGTFNTIVVQPIIKSRGLFGEGGQAEAYFTDDSRRIMVALKSKVKILKSLDLLLANYTPGTRLGAPSSD